MPAKPLDYFIGGVHWLDALTLPLEQLAQNVRTLLSREAAVIERGAGSSPSFRTCLQDLSPEPRGENRVDDINASRRGPRFACYSQFYSAELRCPMESAHRARPYR
jgi:hypothetical protein